MPARRGPPALEWLLLSTVLLFLAVVAARVVFGPESRLAFLLYDDAYYYYKVAWNLVEGLGSTFDGINPTNGYHPLWCWVLLPVYSAIDDPAAALRVIAALWYFFAATAAVSLWWALRPHTGSAGALLAAALFGLHPFLALHMRRPNGLETPLFATLIALSIGLYERACSRTWPGRWFLPATILGLLIGLVILARTDGGFLAVAAALLLVWHLGRREGIREAARAVAALTLAASVVAGPSLAWNTLRFGSPIPISGRAQSAWQESRREAMGGPFSAAFLRSRAAEGLDRIPRRLGRYAVEGSPPGRWIWQSGRFGGLLVLLGAVTLLGVALRLRRSHGPPSGDALSLLAVFAILHYAVYAVWYWTGGEPVFRLYYFLPQSLLAAALIGATAGPLLDRLLPWPRLRAVVLAAGPLLMGTWLLVESSRHLSTLDSAPGPVAENYIYGWVRRNLPPEAVLGAIGSGRLGYFSGRPAVDLDGLSNGTAFLEAIRRDTSDEYVFNSPITHLVGGRATLNGFDPARPDDPPRIRADLGELLFRLASRHACRLRDIAGPPGTSAVIEILRPANAASSTALAPAR